MLEAIAPYLRFGYNADSFVEEPARLVEVSPKGFSALFGKILETDVPSHSYEDRLVEKGKKRGVILHVERLRCLPGMQELFDGLAAEPIRNRKMLDAEHPDLVLAFWDGESAGTLELINMAVRSGYEVRLYTPGNAELKLGRPLGSVFPAKGA